MSPPATVEEETGLVGARETAGSPGEADDTAGTVAGGGVVGRGVGVVGRGVGERGRSLCFLVGLGALAGTAVTVTIPVACAVIGGFVTTSAEAVRDTHVVPLDGVPIWAWRVNDEGVTSVFIGPS